MTHLCLRPSYTPFFTRRHSPRMWPHEFDALFRAPFSMLNEMRPSDGDPSPALGLFETEAAYVVQVNLPGVAEDAIDLRLDGEVLTLSGERKPSGVEGRDLRREIAAGRFEHQVRLPGEVDADNVSATHAAGVLTVTLPKLAAPEPRRIDVKSS